MQIVRFFYKACSCGKWQNYRLPCSHALVVCRNRGDNLGLLVDQQFTKTRWAVQYSGKFNPLSHQDTWLYPGWELQADRSKFVARRVGRVRASRIRNEIDERDPDDPRRCRNCHQTGHNRRNCPNYSIELTSLNVQPNSFIFLSLHSLSIDLLTYLLKECSDGVLYTHTFHLPVEEATVTLQDIEVL
ncbi:unnamed protein product [Coffea canephora]|uniref:SWIM-type domain-containing protein n=1 Tax=Coffea canephora TaxID=49390 RepID=A0A068UB10_COFCA|nr:unnamed protein product [Coffea canephora]